MHMYIGLSTTYQSQAELISIINILIGL